MNDKMKNEPTVFPKLEPARAWEGPTPSMDPLPVTHFRPDSPPIRTTAQYEWDKVRGHNCPPFPTRRRGLELMVITQM